MKRIVSSIIMTLIFSSLLAYAFTFPAAKAQSGTISINPDGSITPETANITTSDNVTYTFTGNNYLPIVVNRSNIVIDGMGHTLEGSDTHAGYSNRVFGFGLTRMSNVTIRNTTVAHFWTGVWLNSSSGINLSGNNATANGMDGFWLYNSSGNFLSDNEVSDDGCYGGINLTSSSHNVLSGNIIYGGRPGVTGGIYFAYSSDNVLYDNNVTTHYYGIFFAVSDNNTLSGNYLAANSYCGIDLDVNSNNNTLFGNTVKANSIYGILIFGNAIGNRVFHNNFLNNEQQALNWFSKYKNTWDDGYPSGGNYWSNYNGTDAFHGPYQNLTGSDGIGDTPYVIDANNTDHYPLMAPFESFNIAWNNQTYSVETVSNSSISGFSFNSTVRTLSFNVTGTNGTTGFCRVAIPLSLMSCVGLEDWIVTVNGNTPLNLSITSDANYTYIYLVYHHSTETIKIASTYAVSELQLSMLMPLFMIITLLGATIFKKKRNRKMQPNNPYAQSGDTGMSGKC